MKNREDITRMITALSRIILTIFFIFFLIFVISAANSYAQQYINCGISLSSKAQSELYNNTHTNKNSLLIISTAHNNYETFYAKKTINIASNTKLSSESITSNKNNINSNNHVATSTTQESNDLNSFVCPECGYVYNYPAFCPYCNIPLIEAKYDQPDTEEALEDEVDLELENAEAVEE